MEYKTPQPLITLSVLFIIGAIAVGYYLDGPLYNKLNGLKQEVSRLEKSKELKANYENQIKEINQKLTEIDWNSRKQKIEINFESSPFFLSKVEIFFKNTALKDGMTYSGVTFAQAVTVKTANTQQAQTSGDVKTSKKDYVPQEEGSTSTAQQTSSGSFSSINGPVNKTAFTLSVSGSYESLKVLLLSMEKQSLLISVKTITFSAIENNGKGSYTIMGDIYSY
jgi:hypothetical protein